MVKDTMSYYERLNLAPNASEAEIKQAYFTLIREYSNETHPKEFQLLTEAFKTLKDNNKRREYDEQGSNNSNDSKRLEDAWRSLKQGDFNKAISITNQILKESPGNREALQCKAYAFLHKGDGIEANIISEKLLRETPNNIDCLILGVDVKESIKEHKEAINLVRKLIELTGDIDWCLKESRLLNEIGRSEQALQSLRTNALRFESIEKAMMYKEILLLAFNLGDPEAKAEAVEKLKTVPEGSVERLQVAYWMIALYEENNLRKNHPLYINIYEIVSYLNQDQEQDIEKWLEENDVENNNYQKKSNSSHSNENKRAGATEEAFFIKKETVKMLLISFGIFILFSIFGLGWLGFIAGAVYFFVGNGKQVLKYAAIAAGVIIFFQWLMYFP
ncbi:DnaJ domain-containing protein [Marinococcus sp. PL1-022]|uniref:DnaJ domain-containing protein n=1 Tax=Marinococcus sp. PL1-022 TaxID=3095363 RepID=UPI0029C3A019|nr:DnaJ domain-containing protein [Marinococcus sp. PL1-022]MDX6153933.1 DnaJ domain-containing protein [Marinococcus sp. PL1-022]